MSIWSDDMEIERKIVSEKLKSDLIQIAFGLETGSEVKCAEVIDPTTGQPLNGKSIQNPIFESDKRISQLDHLT